MLRPLLTFATLTLAAFILAPTVVSLQEKVEEKDIYRELPWRLWKWDDDPEPPSLTPPDCDWQDFQLISEITDWPPRIDKNESFTLGGFVGAQEQDNEGVPDITVDVFLNETKDRPGVPLGTTVTGGDGRFSLQAKIPFDLGATKYHLVAHAHEKHRGCHHYEEHWSDPELDVVSLTKMELDLPRRAVVGRNTTIVGTLLDGVGAPVRNATVKLLVKGERIDVATDDEGVFKHEFVPETGGDVEVKALFEQTKYYGGSNADGKFPVRPEDVVFDGSEGPFGLEVVRNETTTLSGHVLLARGAKHGPITLTFEGPRVAECPTCAPKTAIEVPVSDEGRFAVDVVVPSSEPSGEFLVRTTKGGLQGDVTQNGTVFVAVDLDLDARGVGFWTAAYKGRVIATDDRGEPVSGNVVVLGPGNDASGDLDANGTFQFQSDASCGFHGIRASYAGSEHHLHASKETRVGVCGIFAFLPSWVLAFPWWGWPLLAASLVGLWLLARALRDRYATTITRGPPVHVKYTHTDELPEVAGVGERVTMVARLEEALPEGYALRMGHHGAMTPSEAGADLSASWSFTPEKRGDHALRAEILDEKGRIVTRRTLPLHVVLYGAEIETRYRRFKRERLGDESDVVSPRDFESWLRTRAPDLPHDTIQTLVNLFEEADYSPRDAGRAEFLAYVRAERSSRAVAPSDAPRKGVGTGAS